MTDVFLRVLNMSVSAGILALVVLLARALLMKKAPKRLFPILWGLVGIRLVLPFTFQSVLSLLPSAEVVPPEILLSDAPALTTGITVIDVSSEAVMAPLAPTPENSANPLQIWGAAAAAVWILGIAVMLLYAAVSTGMLRRRMREAVLLDGNVFLTDRTDSPFVLGIVRPRIYIPFTLRDRDLPFVLAHERAHIARRDHWIKPAAFLLLSVYWFNPILWIAFILLCRDVELACDERVVKGYTPGERADYSEALLACSVTRRHIAACPVAFGEVGVKTRIRTVLNYRRPAFWMTVFSVLVVAVLAVCFLTDPVSAAIKNPAVGEYEAGAEGIVGAVDKAAFEEISPDFAIGADRYGVAVFQNPRRAWETFQKLYADDLEALEELHGLKPLSAKNRDMYLVLAAQTEGQDEETTERYRFVSKFLDIYENSFDNHSGIKNTAGTTSEVVMPSDSIPHEVWVLAVKKAADRGVKITKDSALVLYYGGDTHYVFPTGEGNQPVTVLASEAGITGYNSTSIALRNAKINMPSLDDEYFILSSATNQVQSDCIDRIDQAVPGVPLQLIPTEIDSIEEVCRIDPEPNFIGVGYCIRYRIALPEPYADILPKGCSLLEDGTYEAPPLYGMTLSYSLGDGYTRARFESVPYEKMPDGSVADVSLSLLTRFWEESVEEMRLAVQEAAEKQRTAQEDAFLRLGTSIPVDFADGCDPDTRHRQILTQYLTTKGYCIKGEWMTERGMLDFQPVRAKVSELTLCGLREKVTVRDGQDFYWFEVALLRADYRMILRNPENAADISGVGMKADGDTLAPDNGPILIIVISELDKKGDYTVRYTFEEYRQYREGHLFDFFPRGKSGLLRMDNVETAVTELIREYESKH